MFKKLDEIKVLRDPIHGYIHVEYEIIWKSINSKEMQRLRRIRQLGASFIVYHTAEHSRFAHSLGVYEIVRRMITENQRISENLSELEKIVVMLAGLLHDLGHGPYSHAFEAVSEIHHEEFTKRILLGDSEIHQILEKEKRGLAKQVAQVIDHTHPKSLLTQLVSGQLDADRMDYLLRDAYFTGTKYGEFDLERILRTLRVKDGRIVVKSSGIHTVEDYIMARYHMYWQVYYHPTARSYENILECLFNRLKACRKENPKVLKRVPMFKELLLTKEMSIHDHFLLDENACLYGFSQLIGGEDEIASDLAYRLINRKLFDYENFETNQQVEKIKQRLEKQGLDLRYYFIRDEVKQRPYQPYQGREDEAIWVLTEDQRIQELSEASVIVSALNQGELKNDIKIFFPKKKKDS